ncbi:60S ribosomal protein L3 (nucleomorph) [Chroomonas mesostigmatica CCMP1168]|uniref:60S ribosomal protein L3 n=1 Tax=Chroomonas mesostigmatica CCMP1168 TaxID=1195612 RepID=J7G2D2_9CRYP|nr:60S ribosomal protein L3 [Chroomonas mesostigmatica CCMP1168]|mmetsp:Transcript_58815/g.144187  ORF Transcript_58815/g.144187 Transcript_58815/m.144187 type:complete len:389 (-) Transcript_58815:3755-4921(-)
MSHRKYESPRHGSLGFLPKKRCQRKKGKIKSFPKDSENSICHLTAALGYKAGMTHVVRTVDKLGSKLHGKDCVEAVTILETPPLEIIGYIGYIKTPRGLRAFRTIWSNSIFPEEFRRNFYKNWYKSKKKAFSKKTNLKKMEFNFIEIENQKKKFQIKKFCSVIRCISFSKISKTGLKQKKAKILEIQVNGGNSMEKVDFIEKMFNKEISISDIFKQREIIDVVGITKGKGFEGVISRWGVTKLPRKTHRGARKVACVGSWHPSRISFRVPRAGQNGYHHRTQNNIQIYKVGKASDPRNASTDFDLTEKKITPMGGFPYYGIIKEDFLILKGCILGSRKRPITLRKSLSSKNDKFFGKKIILKFIDTSSKWGHGRFQTSQEKIETFRSG